ncbi:hypothetical protein [Planctomicrobium sp. SH664]|uniref:hypothetical protein n=1 Tax=Planctomicrobium sp. SH664 TaxID=3448125 RepID=UPI003F5AFB6C
MDDSDLQLLKTHLEWQQILEAYAEQTEEQPLPPGELHGPRWFKRIGTLPGLEGVDLNRAHGQLIALGWLKVQLDDGSAGLSYRIASEGRQALELCRRQTQPVRDSDTLAA